MTYVSLPMFTLGATKVTKIEGAETIYTRYISTLYDRILSTDTTQYLIV